LKNYPELVNEDPYGKGWLIIVKPANLQAELANLLEFNAAVEWHKNQAK
jgi:glycine cleavage system H protein